jgi:hypothetical protein
MPDSTTRTGRRGWSWMVAAFVVSFLVIVVLALWSEREDADRLPAEELDRRGEEPWAPEPVDSPALPASPRGG